MYYHSTNLTVLRVLLFLLLSVSIPALQTPSSPEPDKAPTTGGITLPAHAPYGAYIAAIPGHPSNPSIPHDMTITAELISEFNLTLPDPEGPFPSVDSQLLGFPKPYKHDCKGRQQFSAAGYDELVKRARIVQRYWNGKTKVRHGQVAVLWYDDLVIWFCNSRRTGYQKPSWKRYYAVDGYVEGVCGSRIEGGVGVKAWGASYGRRKWRGRIDGHWFCADFSYNPKKT